MSVDPTLLDQAMDWHVRMLGETDPGAWDELCAWLEVSPDHAGAYEQVAALEADIGAPLLAMPAIEAVPIPSANDNEPRWRGGRGFVGWLAAATSIAAGFAMFVHRPDDPGLMIVTPMGQTRTTTLADGSEIHINGGSKLLLGGSDRRTVQLLAGEAAFTVHHDEAHPFAVMIGDHELRDVGTRFNVRRDGQDFVLEVAEGRVAFDPSGGNIELGAGEALALQDGEARRFAVPVEQVGEWQQRRLSYDAAPISGIAEDLTRMLGIPVTVAPAVSTQRYTGTIVVPTDRAEAMRAIGLTLDLSVLPNKGGYLLTR